MGDVVLLSAVFIQAFKAFYVTKLFVYAFAFMKIEVIIED